MDIDITAIRVEGLKKIVMDILSARGFTDSLKFLGIEDNSAGYNEGQAD